MSPINLASFTYKFDDCPSIAVPFHLGNWTYATNGHIIVRIPRVDFDAPECGPDITTHGILAAIESEAPKSPLPAVDVPFPDECPLCAGTKHVSKCRCDGEGCADCKDECYISCEPVVAGAVACDECDGFGVTWPFRSEVWLTPKLAIAPRYYRMLVALPNPRIDLAIDGIEFQDRDGRGSIPFAFDGGAGALMPLRVGRKQNDRAPCYATGPEAQITEAA